MATFNSWDEWKEYILLYGNPFVENYGSEALLRIPGLTEMAIEPPRGSNQRVIRIRFSTTGREAFVGVLWDCLFGQPRLTHWLLLFNAINRISKYDSSLQEIFNIMMFINEKSPSGAISENFLNMKLRSVGRIFGYDVANEIAERLRRSGISIPVRKPSLKMFCTIETKHFRKSPEVRRIGVGYKDKGHLGSPGSEYDPTEIPHLRGDSIKIWEMLLRSYQQMKAGKN